MAELANPNLLNGRSVFFLTRRSSGFYSRKMMKFQAALRAMLTLGRYLLAWLFSLTFAGIACLAALLLGPSRMWTVFCGPWARTTLRILGIQTVVHHAERLRGPAVFVANHQSLLDVVLLPALLPANTRFVARRELRHIPFWGWAFMMGGAIPIERRGRGGDAQRLEAGLSRLPRGWSVTIFPEGTRRRHQALGPFRRGAFFCAARLGHQVVPVGIGSLDMVSPVNSRLLRAGVVHLYVGTPIAVASSSATNVHAATQQGYSSVAACVRAADDCAFAPRVKSFAQIEKFVARLSVITPKPLLIRRPTYRRRQLKHVACAHRKTALDATSPEHAPQ